MDPFLIFLLIAFSTVLILNWKRKELKGVKKIAAAGATISATDLLVTSISLPPLVVLVILFSVAMAAIAFLARD